MRVETKNGERHYIEDGMRYPSVTTALGVLRRPELEMLRGVIGNKKADRARDEAANTGILLHEICELILKGNLTGEFVVSPETAARISAFTDWVNEHVVEVIGTEIEGIDYKYHYGYKADALLVLKGSKVPMVGDIKTGAVTVTARIQTAAYARALKVKKRGLIWIPKEGPVKFIPHDNLELDFNAFLCCLNLYNWSKRY